MLGSVHTIHLIEKARVCGFSLWILFIKLPFCKIPGSSERLLSVNELVLFSVSPKYLCKGGFSNSFQPHREHDYLFHGNNNLRANKFQVLIISASIFQTHNLPCVSKRYYSQHTSMFVFLRMIYLAYRKKVDRESLIKCFLL